MSRKKYKELEERKFSPHTHNLSRFGYLKMFISLNKTFYLTSHSVSKLSHLFVFSTTNRTFQSSSIWTLNESSWWGLTFEFALGRIMHFFSCVKTGKGKKNTKIVEIFYRVDYCEAFLMTIALKFLMEWKWIEMVKYKSGVRLILGKCFYGRKLGFQSFLACGTIVTILKILRPTRVTIS